MWKPLALAACCASVSVPSALADVGNSIYPTASGLTQFQRDQRALRRKVDREPLPLYITMCESHGDLRAENPSGAGGRYQIMPETWGVNLPPRERVIRLAEGDDGPTWSSRLLQDIVAKNVRDSSGLGAWSCA